MVSDGCGQKVHVGGGGGGSYGSDWTFFGGYFR